MHHGLLLKVETYFSAGEVDPARVVGATAVVIDVIRATSTIIEALAAGAQAVYPRLSSDEAIELANSLGREDTLLCGERRGLRIEGFDLGNSPLEFERERVAGKRLVMSTTNGTRAFLAAEDAERVLAASLMNLSAVRDEVVGHEHLVFVCAGKEDRFSLDDALCAGLIIQKLMGTMGRGSVELDLDDASRSAVALAKVYEPNANLLRQTAAGAALVEVGLAADLQLCADIDRYRLVPEMQERMIRLPDEE